MHIRELERGAYWELGVVHIRELGGGGCILESLEEVHRVGGVHIVRLRSVMLES